MSSRIFNEAFFSSLAESTRPIEHAITLPPECYTDRDFYEFEKTALFDREWLCVGRDNWLPKPGSPALTGASFAGMDAFFSATTYRGAFGNTNWTSGWSSFTPKTNTY